MQVETQYRTIVSLDPATGAVLAELECAETAEIEAAVERAREARRSWAVKPAAERVRFLRAFQQLLHAQKDDVAALISREAGKPMVEALTTEVVVALDAAGFYSREAEQYLRPQPVPHANPVMKSRRSYLLREPYGVVGIISPWNYPFSIPASEAMSALVAGNAVVLKPSELTPLVALRLKELFAAAGLPADLFQVVIGDGAAGAALIESKIDKLIFTGSVATGRRIAQAAAARLLPVVLELGGKDPMIVLDDADVEIASSAAVWGAFMNAGQTCLSVERCYVHQSLFDGFVDRCTEKAKQVRVGRGDQPETEMGPLISATQLNKVEAQVEDARSRGARIWTGGERLPQLGPNFYAPTVITGVIPEMQVLREETFGPLLPIMSFQNDDEAIALANDSEFGLSASVWTRNRERGEALARRIEAGTVMVNDVITCFGISEAPHGGIKSSGMGRTHGRLGLDEMVRVKYVDSDLLSSVAKVWWFGYGAEFKRQMQGFTDALFAPSLGKRLAGALASVGAFFRKGRL